MSEYFNNLHRIEFLITMACTGKCKHCSEGEHINCKEHIDANIAEESIRRICENYNIESLMTFGGEALLYPDVVCKIHNTAKLMNVGKRQLITNGFFSKKQERIEEVVNNLAESGVNDLLLSVDAFHQEFIPIDIVKYFATCVTKIGIPVKLSPAWLVSVDDNNPYNNKTREIIHEFDFLQIPLGSGNIIFPSGNALKYLSEYFDKNITESNPYKDDPKDVKAISFSPNGDVLNGNVYKTDILEIMRTYEP